MTKLIPFVGRITPREREECLQALNAHLSSVQVVPLAEMNAAARAQAELAVVANPDPTELATLPNLKWVQSLWAGVEKLVAELPGEHIQIVRMTDPQLAETMSEAVLAWTLYLHRDMPAYRRQQVEKNWHQRPLKLPSQRPIGILGLGKLGRASARKLSANGFPVLGWSRNPTEAENVQTFSGEDGLAEILRRSAILVILLPLTPETRGLMDDERFAQLPAKSAIINFARGPIVQTEALLRTLDRQHLGHAVLDVFDTEPLPASSPLWSHPDITILPHISAPTQTETASRVAAENIQNYFETGIIPPSVDRSVGY
ncbi:2-hydroxyacid dehydrogenase [Kozakia baliensis]|uniref:2-hydroxyacid dehydrogenase n=1 Tax=Kozakia baliensis TaxID=153496 RepID=UPI00087CB94F|nr:glyoxylate/hydroxypyruvate reductase A [Kozakia baliensis]AOX20617.1 glyoxylate/hydroxypyruvate reductase A [Kozakia baliensis]